MSLSFVPILLFPQGSEEVSTKIIEIKWKSPSNYIELYEEPNYFEIYFKYFVNNFDSNDDWISLARIPSDSFSFRWTIPEFVFGAKIIIAVRSVSFSGKVSEFAQSGPVHILGKSPPKPSISNPMTGKKYGSQISINLENSLSQEDAKRLNRYRLNLYYSSNENQISLAPISERVSGSVSKIIWDTSGLTPSSDYMLYCFYTDDYGRKGPQAVVGPFSIENQGYVLIDTDSPEVAVKISSNNGFVKERTINVEIFAYDEINDIHGFKLIENKRNDDGSISSSISESEPRFFQKSNYLQLKDEDARYVVSALVQDLGGNRSEERDFSLIKKRNKFRKLYSKNLYKITSWAKFIDSIYIALYNGSFTQVLKIQNGIVTIISSFQDEVNSMAFVAGKLYASRINDDRVFDLVSIEPDGLVEIASLVYPDTQISAIGGTPSGEVIIGSINGNVYKIYNQNIVFINNIGAEVYAIDNGDFGKVFILGQSSDKVFVYSKDKIYKVTISI